MGSSLGLGGGPGSRDLGESAQAIKLSTTALQDYEPWRVRNRCFVQIDLASAHLLNRDLEQVAAVGRDALRTAAPPLADLDTRITDFLTRTTRRQQHDDR